MFKFYIMSEVDHSVAYGSFVPFGPTARGRQLQDSTLDEDDILDDAVNLGFWVNVTAHKEKELEFKA